MKMYEELKSAIGEETLEMPETAEFKQRFSKLLENYMDGMKAESEIADMIEMVSLDGVGYED